MSIQHILTSLVICLKKTCFVFQGKYYEKSHGAAMGFPIIPFFANMEEFEYKTISTAPNPPRIWLRCVDETFVIKQAKHSQQFLQHINSIDIFISPQTPNSNSSIPFLDNLFSPGSNNTLLNFVYRKHAHMHQCLHWDGHHNLSAKYSAFNSLAYRARTVCTNQQLLKEEEEHVRKALHRCKYPTWSLNRPRPTSNIDTVLSGPKQTSD